jgi:hypothetical protein
VVLVVLAAFILQRPEAPAGGAEKKIETKKAKVKAKAKQVGVGIALSNPPPNSKALLNRKQQQLRRRRPPLPMGPPPAGVAAPKPPNAADATFVPMPLAAPATAKLEILPASRPLEDSETKGQTSTVCEPSLAVRGDEILLTGNWFAAISKDKGASFNYRNPYTIFPRSGSRDFCCDQVAHYDKANDLMFWLLQYVSDSSGNILRVAVAKGSDIRNERWRYYDFSPQSVGEWSGVWFDYPDLTVGAKYLYVSCNVLQLGTDAFSRSLLLRLPLAQLASYADLDVEYFTTTEVAGLRATQGASDPMYFGANRDRGTIRVFTWPEGSTTAVQTDVHVQPWNDKEADWEAPGPDGYDWLPRADGRITAAWQSKDRIGFAWAAARDSQHRWPHVRVAVLDRKTRKVLAQPNMWNPQFAFAFPAAAVNADGQVAFSVLYGGNTLYPSHTVGLLVDDKQWELLNVAVGTAGPADGKWGDYVSIRPHGTDPKTWVATGFSLQGGELRGKIQVRYVHIGLK